MGKWILILVGLMLALAVVGFLVDAAKFLIGVALFGLVVIAAFKLLGGSGKTSSG